MELRGQLESRPRSAPRNFYPPSSQGETGHAPTLTGGSPCGGASDGREGDLTGVDGGGTGSLKTRMGGLKSEMSALPSLAGFGMGGSVSA